MNDRRAVRQSPMRVQRPIVVDSREQRPLLIPGQEPGLDVQRATLRSGDYTIAGLECEVLVERKSAADLVACIGRERRRFEAALTRMAEETRLPVLLIEATASDVYAHRYPGRVHPRAAIGSVLGWCHGLGVVPLFADDRATARRLLVQLLALVERRRDRAARRA